MQDLGLRLGGEPGKDQDGSCQGNNDQLLPRRSLVACLKSINEKGPDFVEQTKGELESAAG